MSNLDQNLAKFCPRPISAAIHELGKHILLDYIWITAKFYMCVCENYILYSDVCREYKCVLNTKLNTTWYTIMLKSSLVELFSY